MSLRDTIDDASWVTYATPLVRVLDSSTGSTPGATSLSDRERSAESPRARQEQHSTIIEEYFPELRDQAQGQGQQPMALGAVDGFPAVVDWNLAASDLPLDLFDAVPSNDMNFWEDPGA